MEGLRATSSVHTSGCLTWWHAHGRWHAHERRYTHGRRVAWWCAHGHARHCWTHSHKVEEHQQPNLELGVSAEALVFDLRIMGRGGSAPGGPGGLITHGIEHKSHQCLLSNAIYKGIRLSVWKELLEAIHSH